MKNSIIVFSIIIICIFSLITFAKINHLDLSLNLETDDCAEFGICKQGTEYIIGDEKFIINKETCISHGRKWHEDIQSCFMR